MSCAPPYCTMYWMGQMKVRLIIISASSQLKWCGSEWTVKSHSICSDGQIRRIMPEWKIAPTVMLSAHTRRPCSSSCVTGKYTWHNFKLTKFGRSIIVGGMENKNAEAQLIWNWNGIQELMSCDELVNVRHFIISLVRWYAWSTQTYTSHMRTGRLHFGELCVTFSQWRTRNSIHY